jgi:hypothetical protein
MGKGFLEDREKALETEYFRKQERQLIEMLRQRLDRNAHRESLAAHSSIRDEGLLEHLVALGVHADTLVAVSLVPVIAVGWASGALDDKEREAIRVVAVEHGVVAGSEAWILLSRWLEQAPGPDLIETWKRYIAAVSETLEPPARQVLKRDLMKQARQIAEASGGLLGVATISPAERRVLDELESAFA